MIALLILLQALWFPGEQHDGMMMVFGVEPDLREDALLFLLNKFEGLEPELQYHTVSALRTITNQPSLKIVLKHL